MCSLFMSFGGLRYCGLRVGWVLVCLCKWLCWFMGLCVSFSMGLCMCI